MRVSGTTSGPTFSCTAIFWSVLNRVASCVIVGFNAYWRPFGSAVVGVSSVLVRLACGIARPPEVVGSRIAL